MFLFIKYHLLRYACRQNPHLRLVNSGFGASQALQLALSEQTHDR